MQISLCDDIEELKEAYFRNFKAEGIAQPHKLYTGSWRTATMAKNLGVSVDVLDGDSAFVLIKLVKTSGTVAMAGDLRLRANAAGAAAKVRAGDVDSVLDFVQTYGSHYIQSVTVGDAIYQVSSSESTANKIRHFIIKIDKSNNTTVISKKGRGNNI